MHTDLLTVRGFSAAYANKEILRDINFTVSRGELVCIFGENGSGKTTLLKALTGLDVRAEGTAMLEGRDVLRMKEKERAAKIAVLAQQNPVPSGLLFEEILEMGLYPRLRFLQMPDASMKEEMQKLIVFLGLENLTGRYFDELSQGQRQMTLFARMLLQGAPLLMMDEPDAALDYKNKHRLFLRLHEILREENRAGIVILHDAALALTYCDRMLLLEDGTISSEVVPAKETEESIAQKLKPLLGNVRVIKDGQFVSIRPETKGDEP